MDEEKWTVRVRTANLEQWRQEGLASAKARRQTKLIAFLVIILTLMAGLAVASALGF